MELRIGTRKSPLAMAQAEMVKSALLAAMPAAHATLVPITTSADMAQEKPLYDIGGKGLFTKELDEALVDGRIDIAVHSMKDVPAPLPQGLVIGAMLEREDVRDAFISSRYKDMATLPQGATFGTSSPRRAAQVLGLRPDLKIIPFRGNVNTRLKKIEDGVADATLLALAGLKRMGLEAKATNIIPVEVMLPAASQGAIGVECRAQDTDIINLLQRISHEDTMIVVSCERAMLEELNGNCQTPIAGLAEITGDSLRLRGFLALPDGSHPSHAEVVGKKADWQIIGREVGKKLKGQNTRFHIL